MPLDLHTGMEPTTTSAGGFAISKGLAALAGLFGGLSVSFFWQPKKLHQHGRLAAGAIIGGISVSAAFALGGIVARLVGLNFLEVDIALGLGYLVGAISVGIVAWLANFFDKREDSDLLEVAQEIQAVRKGTPRRKTPAKRKPSTRRVKS